MEVPLGDSLNLEVLCIKDVKSVSGKVVAKEGKVYKITKKVKFIWNVRFDEEDHAIYFIGEDGEEHYLLEEPKINGFWQFFKEIDKDKGEQRDDGIVRKEEDTRCIERDGGSYG